MTMQLIEAYKIWDQAPHNAFTDLIFFEGYFYCAFREGEHHMSYDGKLRVIRSQDTKNWTNVALIGCENGDVRDAKLSITPNNELMLNGGVRLIETKNGNITQSLTWFSKNGLLWSEAYVCPSGLGTWRWSTTWHKDTAYSFAYTGKDKQGCLYTSEDGKIWTILKNEVYPDIKSYGNETSLVFLENDEAYCLLRRDKESATAMLGISKPPYTNWNWNDLGIRIGGPKMIFIKDNRFLAAVRLYANDDAWTALCWIDLKKMTLKEGLKLPSGNDTSYAGLVEREGFIWVSYYSSHEEKTAIYFAKVKLA